MRLFSGKSRWLLPYIVLESRSQRNLRISSFTCLLGSTERQKIADSVIENKGFMYVKRKGMFAIAQAGPANRSKIIYSNRGIHICCLYTYGTSLDAQYLSNKLDIQNDQTQQVEERNHRLGKRNI